MLYIGRKWRISIYTPNHDIIDEVNKNLTSANPLIMMWFHPLWHSYCLFFISDSVNHLHPRTSSLQLDTQCSKREAHASPQPGEPTVSIDWNNRSSGPGSGSGLQIWQWWPVPVGLSPGLCLNFRPIKISNTHSLLMIELCKLLRSAFVFQSTEKFTVPSPYLPEKA